MGLNRYAKRRDAGERAVIEALEQVGCLVWQLDEPGDLLVCVRPHSAAPILILIECKEKAGKLTKGQKKALDQGWPLHIARTPEQAVFIVNRIAANQH